MSTGKVAAVLAAVYIVMVSGYYQNALGGEYTATSVLRISAQEPVMLGESVPRSLEKDRYEIYKNTQRQLITSRFVLLAALRKPEVAKLPSVQAEQQKGDPVRWLEKIVEVKLPGHAEIMSVSVTRSDPQEAVVLVRAVVDAYLSEVVNAERDQKQHRLSELDRAYAEQETEVRAKRKLAEQLGTLDSEKLALKQKLALEELSIYWQEKREIHDKLRSFKIDLAVQKAHLEEFKTDGDRWEIKRLEASIAAVTEQESKVQADIDRCRKEAEKYSVSAGDIEIMRNVLPVQSNVLAQIGAEREKLKVEARATPRVTLLQRAEVPEEKD